MPPARAAGELVVPRLVGRRHAGFEVGGAVDLAGDEHAAVDQQRGLTALDDLEPLALQGPAAQGRQLHGLGTRDGQPPAGPGQRVDGHGQCVPGGQRGQPTGVVEVAVTEDQALHLA